MDEEIAELLSQIEAAFEGVPRPSAITKSVARALDDEWTLSEQRHRLLYSQDTEARWQDLTDDQLEAYNDIFSFLDQEGWHFYLPAFMGYELRQRSGMALQSIVSFACAYFDMFQLLNEEQMHCLIAFLTHFAFYGDSSETSDAALAVDALESRIKQAGSK